MSFVSLTSSPAGASLECAAQAVKNMGYPISNDTPRSISAEKKTSGVGQATLNVVDAVLAGLGGTAKNSQSPTWSALSVSTFDSPAGDTNLRVTVWHAQGDRAATRGSGSWKPTKHGISDAKTILKACGKGEISEQPCASRKTWQPMSACNP